MLTIRSSSKTYVAITGGKFLRSMKPQDRSVLMLSNVLQDINVRMHAMTSAADRQHSHNHKHKHDHDPILSPQTLHDNELEVLHHDELEVHRYNDVEVHRRNELEALHHDHVEVLHHLKMSMFVHNSNLEHALALRTNTALHTGRSGTEVRMIAIPRVSLGTTMSTENIITNLGNVIIGDSNRNPTRSSEDITIRIEKIMVSHVSGTGATSTLQGSAGLEECRREVDVYTCQMLGLNTQQMYSSTLHND